MKALVVSVMGAALLTAACDGYNEGQPGAIGTAGTYELRGSPMSDDEATTSEVEANLLALPELERDIASGRVEVDTDDGVVTLDGHVDSAAEIESAVDMAWASSGVTDVRNSLEVARR